MTMSNEILKEHIDSEYKWGFTTNIDADTAPKGLNEDIIRFISAKKKEPQWLLDYRLKAFKHWKNMVEPEWAHVQYTKPDFQDIIYYSAPKVKPTLESLDQVDPELLKTFEKLGISLEEQKRLSGVQSNIAVDAVFDSVSVKTTFRETLAEKGVIFCSFSEAVQEHPELVKKYMGMVVPHTD
ncbi:MAG TPA: Fe-S cluster assembly protein SufB, partial [Bacteroidia bacterium]|nr:Fe-S cluster assembly protein SufB [Bacteroidia bacterium]